MFADAYQFNVHQLAEVLHGLSKDADVHELEQVFLKVLDGFLPQLSGAGGFSLISAYLETYTAGGCDDGASIVSCRRGWGPPFHSLLGPF